MKRIITYPIIIYCFLLFSITSQAQDSPNPDYNVFIPKDQYIFTQDSKGSTDLYPYKKEYIEYFGAEKTTVIEIGDFVIKEFYKNDTLQRDTLWYAISTTRINNIDTIKQVEKIELKKLINYDLNAKIRYKGDRIYVEPAPKFKKSAFANVKNSKASLHPKDQDLYFKLEDGESFKFILQDFATSIIATPFKMRLGVNQIDTVESRAEFQLNNLAIFLGYRGKRHVYKNGKLKRNGFNIGGFFGPSVIKLNNSNSRAPIENEITKLGFNYGLAVMGSIERVNIGVAFGLERMANDTNDNWIFNNKPYLGIVIGYSLKSY